MAFGWSAQPRSSCYLPASVFPGFNARQVCAMRLGVAKVKPNGQSLRVGSSPPIMSWPCLPYLTASDAHLCAQLRIICCFAVHSSISKTQLRSGYRDQKPGWKINMEARAQLWLCSTRERLGMQGMCKKPNYKVALSISKCAHAW